MKKSISMILAALFVLAININSVSAHCEIPCGIYDDATRMALINEHIKTIEKSMLQIRELEKGTNTNQLVRWVGNKEKHAELLQEIVTQYFMTQRIKLNAENYEKKIGALHRLLVFSMKCKQTTDLANIEKLQEAADEFHKLYFPH